MASTLRTCCCAKCFPEAGVFVLRQGATNAAYGLAWPDRSHLDHSMCHRLFSWERRAVTASTYGGAQAADHITMTNRATARTGMLGPFETTPGSGILLDAEPYWWSSCRVGGWQIVGSMWYQPTLADVQTTITTTLVDGTYTLLALMRYSHWKRQPADGGAVVIPYNNGQAKLMAMWHLQY